MKVFELIVKLQQVNPNNTVYLECKKFIFDFTGVGFDDNNDVSLYVAGGDKEA